MLPLIWLYAYLAVSIPALLIVYAFRRWHNLKTLLNRPTATLELIPPALSHKSSLATERLFTVLHGLGVDCFSFEVVSSRSGGIRYLLQVAETEVDVFEQQLVAYLPDIQFRVVSDYTDFRLDQRQSIRLVEFKQLRHFAYPLAAHQDLAKHDPIAYLTGAMTGLETNELVAFQLVLSATHPPEVSSIRRALLHGQKPELSPNIWAVLLGLEVKLLLAAVWLARECMAALYGPQQSSAQTSNNPPRPVPVSTTLLASIENKLAQPLFRVNIRTLVIVENKQRGRSVLQAIKAALGNFTVPGYQQLASWRLSLGFIGQQYQLFMFRRRWLALFATNSCVLSASEVSALYHFPYGKTSRTENLVQSYAKTLPVPLSVKRHADASDFDLVLGQNQHHGNTTAIGLTAAERERHVYIIGGTGNGKTTLLQYGIVQDIRSGKGLAIIDPHGDLATTILKYIPEQRMNDVIYFNPSDFDYPIGLNLLEVPAGLSGSELLHEQDMVTESVISILRKTFSEDDSGGHRIEYVLRNAIHTAMTVPDATLFTVLTLLTDTKYRNKVVKQLDDQLLKSFWTDEMGRAGAMQQVKMSNGVTTKIGRFQASVSAQRVLGQARSTIDFEDIINSGKILICNFSKGRLGEDTATLFGTAVLAKLQMVAWRREKILQAERRPFYLFVDEFQNFATMPFLQILSEARKYKLFLTMAEQSTSQQDQQHMVDNILANVGTVICFRSGSPRDEEYILPLFRPYIEQGEIANLPAYHFYLRVAALEAQEPFSGETMLLSDHGSEIASRAVIMASRQNFASTYKLEEPPAQLTQPGIRETLGSLSGQDQFSLTIHTDNAEDDPLYLDIDKA